MSVAAIGCFELEPRERIRECAALGTLSDLRAIGIETLGNTEEEAVCMHPSERSGADGCIGLVSLNRASGIIYLLCPNVELSDPERAIKL
jgi:hypothetical protein